MKHLWLGTIAVVALIAGGEAQAADIPVTKAPPAAPVAAPVANWSGVYIGGNAGFAWSRELFNFNTGAPPDPGCAPPTLDVPDTLSCEDFRFTPSSFIGGGQIGIQQQYGSVVFGVEGTWSGTDLHQTDESALFPGSFRSIKINEIATATFRFGAVWEQALIYAKGGFATARVGIHSVEGPNNPLIAAGVTGDVTRWNGGWNLGAGIEYMPWPNFVLGVEFDFYNLQFDTKFPLHLSDGSLFQISGSDASIYAITARLSYLFNWGKAPAAVVAKY